MKTITVKLTVRELRELIAEKRGLAFGRKSGPEEKRLRRRADELEAALREGTMPATDPREEAANRLGLSPQAEARVFGNL